MSKEPEVDLTFVSSDKLIEELAKRHDGIVILREEENDVDSRSRFFYRGSLPRAIGLVEQARYWLIRK